MGLINMHGTLDKDEGEDIDLSLIEYCSEVKYSDTKRYWS